MKLLKKLFFPSIILFLLSCGVKSATQSTEQYIISAEDIPTFNPDSAYQFIQNQVDFGARVPNTDAHRRCAEYLAGELRRFGAEVTEQRADLKAYDDNVLKAVNIIGSFNTENRSRILLMSHWDSRHISDHDPNPANRSQAVTRANDGASGVGVLLEIARQVSVQSPETGIDIVFFDAEDYGAPEDYRGDMKNSWCLGSQYWAVHPHRRGYSARFGILLDMVGAPGATFYKEYISQYYANNIVKKVWNAALETGFGLYFRNEQGGTITDDHLFVNRIAGIPSIDIIHYDLQRGFGEYWHTAHDTMENIDKNTLRAVGTVLMYVIYNEK